MMDAKLAALGLGWITSTIGIVFWVLVIGLLFVIVRFIRRKDYLLAAVTCVPLAALFVLPVMSYMEQREYLAKYEPAKAIFDKLCKEQSAPIIKRTVEDVEGVLLLKVRPAARPETNPNMADWPEAALPTFGKLGIGYYEGYPESFLLDWHWEEYPSKKASAAYRVWVRHGSIGGQHWEDPNNKPGEPRLKTVSRGFRYVDVLDQSQVARKRMTARNDKSQLNHPFPGVAFTSETTSRPTARYGITFEDNIDPELRRHWIAGTTIKIVDTSKNDVIAEQSFWTWDQGFGVTGQFEPWSTNIATCVPRPRGTTPSAMTFIYAVLNAKQGI